MNPQENDKVLIKGEQGIFTLSEINYDRQTCWAEDENNQGWYISFDDIKKIL
jgi:hypothetical protein